MRPSERPSSGHRNSAVHISLVQGVTPPSPSDSWKGLQLTPVTLGSGTSGYRRWMESWLNDYKAELMDCSVSVEPVVHKKTFITQNYECCGPM